MQVNNRITNATINANAAIQGASVVDNANAHREYPSDSHCDTNPVPKCPGKMSSSIVPTSSMRSERRLGLALSERGRLASRPAGGSWRLNSQRDLLPAMAWATLVLNRSRD